MPHSAWNDKRERQYQDIKEGLLKRGRSEGEAEEIAARTVNKERARAGEAEEARRRSTTYPPAGAEGSGPTVARLDGPTTSSATRPKNEASKAAPG